MQSLRKIFNLWNGNDEKGDSMSVSEFLVRATSSRKHGEKPTRTITYDMPDVCDCKTQSGHMLVLLCKTFEHEQQPSYTASVELL